jgi:hypothetical protein
MYIKRRFNGIWMAKWIEKGVLLGFCSAGMIPRDAIVGSTIMGTSATNG